jgi:uncharacterized membrane protein YagU involved in acid resistance
MQNPPNGMMQMTAESSLAFLSSSLSLKIGSSLATLANVASYSFSFVFSIFFLSQKRFSSRTLREDYTATFGFVNALVFHLFQKALSESASNKTLVKI